MTCPHCAAPLAPGSLFCNRCGQRVTPGSEVPGGTPAPAGSVGPAGGTRPSPRGSAHRRSFARPAIVTMIAVLDLLGGALGVGIGLLYVAVGLGASRPETGGAAIVVGLGALAGLLGGLHLAAGIGLLGLKPWARTLQIALAGLALLGIPCGTALGALVLFYILKPEVKLLFSGRSPRDLAPEEIEMIDRLGEGSAVVVVLVAAVVVVVGVAVTGIIAAIAIPSLLRARVAANEAATLGDLRTLVIAQDSYSSANGGHYDTLECLAAPQQCIPGYPDTAPSFLDAAFANPRRHGYAFRLVPGAAATPELAPGVAISPSSFRSYAYVAEPLSPGQTGVRAFCADGTGMICMSAGGRLDEPVGGACPASCTPFK